MRRVIVVGGGIAGMSAAFRLTERGFQVTVLEADDHVGGKTAATRRDGFTLNKGATLVPTTYAAWLALAKDLGVDDQLTPITSVVGVVRDGTVHELRGDGFGAVVDGVRTKLISGRSKLRLSALARDTWKVRKAMTYEGHAARAGADGESIADYCERRLNPELRDRLINPLMGGLFLVEVDRMSTVDLFFSLAKILGGGLLGYDAGADFICRAVAERVDVHLSARVSRVEQSPDGVVVRWTEDGSEHSEEVAGCVITVPAPYVPHIYPQLDSGRQGILNEGIEQADFMGVRFALSRRPDTDVVVICVPEGELDGLGTIMYEHNVAPGCAPPGKGLLGTYVYRSWSDPRLGQSDEEIVEAMLPALDKAVPGIAGMIEFAEVTRWTPGAIVSRPGMHRLIAELDERVTLGDKVQLAGDYLGFPSMNGCVVSGETAARRLAEVT